MLQAKNLKKTYRTDKGKETKALKGVSVDFGEKGLVFILGKSGCGKSTFLHLLGGLDKPDEGEIIIDGKSSKDFTEFDFDSYRNTYVGFVFQEYNLIDSYSVGENIALALELQGKEGQKSLVEETMRKVGLVDEDGSTFYERKPGELSGGQKQRVAIARALVKEPEILLADEPTGALDSETGEQLYDLLKELSKEKLIVVVTHDRESAEKYGDRIIELKDGAILSDRGENGSAAGEEKGGCFQASKLSFKRIFSLGANGLKKKRARLVLSVLLSCFTFLLFGFTVVVGTFSENAALARLMSRNGAEIVMLNARNTEKSDEAYDRCSVTQQAALAAYAGETAVAYYYEDSLSLTHYMGDLGDDTTNFYIGMAASAIFRFVELDADEGAAQMNLTPDPRFLDSSLCRLPETATEIAITDIRADAFIRCGYLDEEGNLFEIATPDDLIGKTIGGLTICGVYQTETDKSVFQEYDVDFPTSELGKDAFELEISWYSEENQDRYHGAQYSLLLCGFVCEGYGEQTYGVQPNGAFIRLSGKSGRDAKLLNALSKDLSYEEENGTSYWVNVQSYYSPLTASADTIADIFTVPALIGSGVLTVFSVLLSMNFIGVNIDSRRKEFWVLRALGATKKDVVNVCLVQSGLLAAAEFVLSVVALAATCTVFNHAVFSVSLFFVNFLSVFLMFVLSFGVSAIATIVPVRKIGGAGQRTMSN